MAAGSGRGRTSLDRAQALPEGVLLLGKLGLAKLAQGRQRPVNDVQPVKGHKVADAIAIFGTIDISLGECDR
jgi:hypothetical protein